MPEKKSPIVPPPRRPAREIQAPISFDFRQPLIVLRAHLWMALALALVVCTLVAWQQLRQPKLYSAVASMMIDRSDRIEGLERPDAGDVSLMTRLELLRSPDLLKRVVQSLTPAERERLLSFRASNAPTTDFERVLTTAVRSAVTVSRREGTTLLNIAAVHRDPELAAMLANRYTEEAIRYAIDRSSASGDASLKFLRDQAEDLRAKSEAAETALQEYRQRYGLVSLEANQNIIVDNLKSLNASATGSRVARMAIEARLEQAQTVLDRGGDAAQLASITQSEGLVDLSRRLAELRSKRAVMGERYGRRHPVMQENERSIEALDKILAAEVRTALTSLRDLRDKALAEERQLQGQRAEAEKAALDLDQLGVEYNILRRLVETHKASYAQMLTRLNDATITAQLRGSNLKISDLAVPPAVPFAPDPRKTMMIVAFLAVAIMVGYPFSMEMFFGRVRSAADVEYHLNAPLLGEIGSVRAVLEKDRPTLVKSESDEAAAEQFRALYSQMALTSKIDPPKSLLVTSTVPGEGKSFIAANLAECFVAHGRRTLLVDADFRRPTQHRLFGLDNKAGALRWLEEGGHPDDAGLLTDPRLGLVELRPGLFLLRAGGSSRRATELMDSGHLAGLIAALQRKFDIVIVDTPPAGVFPDALAFARACHELIYICRFEKVSRQAVRDVLGRLRKTELEFPGVVLNAMPTGMGGSYYYRNYSYQDAKRYAKDYKDEA